MKHLYYFLFFGLILFFTAFIAPKSAVKWKNEWTAEIYPAEHKISIDSTILCYTDGLTELEDDNGEQYSFERLRDFTSKNYKLGPDVFIKSLTAQLSKFKGNQLFNDDISLLACKFL